MTKSETIEERALRVWNSMSPEQQALYNKAAWLISYHEDISEEKIAALLAREMAPKLAGVAGKMVDMGDGVMAATYSMEQLKAALLGDETLEELVAGKRCSKNVGCGKSLVKDDGSPVYMFDTREEAETYEMEFRRTGLCPDCLNKALDALDDGEDPTFEPYDGEVPEAEGAEPECNGICLYGSDLGVPSSGVAYAHPDCPVHGESA